MESTWSQVIKTCWLADLICYWSVYSYIASAWFLTVKFSIWKTCHFWIFFGHLSFLRIFFFANVSHVRTCIPFYWFFLETFRTDVCFFSSSRCRSNLGCSLNSRAWEHRHRDHSVGKEQFLRKIQGPSSKLTYPLFKAFWRWLSFSPGGICLFLGGYLSTVTFFWCSHDYEDIFRPFLCTESYDLGIGFGFTFSLEIYETISSLQYHWTSLWCFLSIEFHHNRINLPKNLSASSFGILMAFKRPQKDLNRSWKQQLLTNPKATHHFGQPQVLDRFEL